MRVPSIDIYHRIRNPSMDEKFELQYRLRWLSQGSISKVPQSMVDASLELYPIPYSMLKLLCLSEPKKKVGRLGSYAKPEKRNLLSIFELRVRSPPKTGISKMKGVMANLLWDSNGAGNISFSRANWGAGAFSVQNVDLNTPFREVIQSADFSTLVLPSLSTEAQSILNASVHDSVAISSSSIINKVKYWCKDLLQLDYPTHSSGFHDSICFQVMHIPMVSPNIPKGKWIKWDPPPFGILKLNTDGSSRNGMAADLVGCGIYSTRSDTDVDDIITTSLFVPLGMLNATSPTGVTCAIVSLSVVSTGCFRAARLTPIRIRSSKVPYPYARILE
ncbi:hypothetical protein L6452_18268 [Arctium lappa]|uniref:Uncharacterized protein n=1 Tax=Arctium lappa TaxID=4217 RepID=A0ACB9C5Q7_ARCLA|nr:hypothetical protein L6452_18268 [Arctium lappa]